MPATLREADAVKFSNAQIAYHWISFVLILIMFGSGLAYSYDLVGDGGMRVHQIAGQVLIVVLVIRIATRLARRAPPAPNAHPMWERLLAGVVQLALYGVLIAFVVTGYVSASAETSNALIAPVSLAFALSDTGEQFLDLHYMLKWVLLGLIGLHVAGALKHLIIDRDDTFSQMTFNKPTE